MSQTTNTQIAEIDVAKLNQNAIAGLKKLEQVRAQITALEEESKTIFIQGMDDKEGFVKTKLFLSKVRPLRTSLESERRMIVKPINDFSAAISAVYNSCTTDMAVIESPHKKNKEEYEAYQEEQKRLKDIAEAKVIDDKINKAIAAGLEYNPFNACYQNDSGVAVSRMDITNMDEETFGRLLARADERRLQLEKIQKEQEEKAAVFYFRKNQIQTLGANMTLSGFIVANAQDDTQILKSIQEVQDMDDAAFNVFSDEVAATVASNKAYYQKLKDDAVKLQKDKDDLARDREIMKRDKVTIMQNKLSAEGFTFSYGPTIEEGVFIFRNKNFHTVKTVKELFEAPEQIDTLIQSVREAKIKDNADELLEAQQIENKNKAAVLDKERKEAAKKVRSANDLKYIDSNISEILSTLSIVEKKTFQVISDYADKFVSDLHTAVDNFNTSVKHLR